MRYGASLSKPYYKHNRADDKKKPIPAPAPKPAPKPVSKPLPDLKIATVKEDK
jgi:hypothetical protein